MLLPARKRNRQFRPLMITGRLKPGVTIEQAQQEMNAIPSRLAQKFPSSNTGRTVSVEPLQNNFLRADVVRNLWLLLAVVSFVVLIACVNVANLLLARGAARQRETAVRVSLGATRGRLAPQIYVPFAQSPWPQAMAAVRVVTDPQALRRSLEAAVRAVDPDLPLTEVQTMDQIIGERLAPDRLNIALYGGLAALALLLASLGIYGVMAFTVAQRTPEIGLRMALGAGQSQVRLQILREGLTLAAGGLALGLLGAYALGRAMQSTLYGTGALSLPVLLVVSLVLLGTALIACYVPARRASAVDPMTALRQE